MGLDLGKTMRAWLSFVAFVVLPGCLGPSNQPQPEPDLPDSEPHTIADDRFLLSGCEGVATIYDVPQPLMPAGPPNGWEEGNEVAEVHILIYVCERISTGPFERGPIAMMRQYHENVVAPAKCAEGSYDRLRILPHMWFDDPEVASYLNETYGMPARYAEIKVSDTAVAIAGTTRWTFGLPGLEASYLEIQNSTPRDGPTGRFIDRLFWENLSGGVSYLEFNDKRTSSQYNVHVSGKLYPPIVYSTLEFNDYANLGTPEYDSEVVGKFVQFSDTECKKPL